MIAMAIVRRGDLGPSVVIDADAEPHSKTLVFRRPDLRPPLSAAEKTPGYSTRGDHSYEALELEVRAVLAARYTTERSPHAAARHGLAKQYLENRAPVTSKACLLEAFDRQNAEELEASQLEYELDQLDLDEETRRVVRAEVRT